jgi:hypothetical protein
MKPVWTEFPPPATIAAAEQPRFWCDDFDCDLFKVIPETRDALGPVGDVLLRTRGHSTNGRLNHPACWNHDVGLISFFGFSGDPAPSGFHSSDPIIDCTIEEAIRDAWVHTLAIAIEGQIIFNAFELRPHFDKLLWWTRKWNGAEDPTFERSLVLIAVKRAVMAFLAVIKDRPVLRRT